MKSPNDFGLTWGDVEILIRKKPWEQQILAIQMKVGVYRDVAEAWIKHVRDAEKVNLG